MQKSHENRIAKIVIDKGIKIHRTLGPGLLESAYEECLFYELSNAHLRVEKQKQLPIQYEKIRLNVGFRIDILVENKVIIEIKAVECINNIHLAQILTYLKLSQCKLGLLLNFNVKFFKDGIRRVVNKL